MPVFGFNSSRFDINHLRKFLLPILVNERKIEPTVFKKTNLIVPFKFSNLQLFDILDFLGGAINFDYFLKAYKTSDTKGFFRLNCVTTQTNWTRKNFLQRKPLATNFEIAIFLKMIILTIIRTCKKCASSKKNSQSQIFRVSERKTLLQR